MTDKAELEALLDEAQQLSVRLTFMAEVSDGTRAPDPSQITRRAAKSLKQASTAIRALLAENERLQQQLADTKTMLQATGEALTKARQALQETDNAG